MDTCIWRNDGMDWWWTDCHYVTDGIPNDGICPFCGRMIEEEGEQS